MFVCVGILMCGLGEIDGISDIHFVSFEDLRCVHLSDIHFVLNLNTRLCVYTLCKVSLLIYFISSLLYILDELDEEQSDEYVDETKQTPNEEEVRGDNPTEELDKRINNIGEEFELPIQFKSNGSSSDISTTFSKPVRNNNNTSTGSLQSNHETRRSDSNRSFGSKGSSKGINVPRGRYSIDANDDFGSLLLLNNNNMNKKGLLSKAQTQSLRSINNNSNSGGGGENKTYKRSVQDTLRHDEGLASSIFSRNSDYSLGSVSASDRSGSGNIFGSGGTNMTSTANESWTASNTSSGGAGERLNELDEYWSGTNLRKSQVKQQHVEPWTIEGSDRRRNMNNVFDDLVLDDTNKKE